MLTVGVAVGAGCAVGSGVLVGTNGVRVGATLAVAVDVGPKVVEIKVAVVDTWLWAVSVGCDNR